MFSLEALVVIIPISIVDMFFFWQFFFQLRVRCLCPSPPSIFPPPAHRRPLHTADHPLSSTNTNPTNPFCSIFTSILFLPLWIWNWFWGGKSKMDLKMGERKWMKIVVNFTLPFLKWMNEWKNEDCCRSEIVVAVIVLKWQSKMVVVEGRKERGWWKGTRNNLVL